MKSSPLIGVYRNNPSTYSYTVIHFSSLLSSHWLRHQIHILRGRMNGNSKASQPQGQYLAPKVKMLSGNGRCPPLAQSLTLVPQQCHIPEASFGSTTSLGSCLCIKWGKSLREMTSNISYHRIILSHLVSWPPLWPLQEA